MTKLLEKLKKFLSPKATYQSNLDAFVSSKRPTTVAEVEHWIKIYDDRKEFVWGRGL
jgi:hypothetical protein